MELFLGYKTDEIENDFNNTIIDINKNFDTYTYLNTLYFCYQNNTIQ